ncbi:MAG TPA: hypothetical protein VFZ53_19240, partial [Polyangiaceae bacterium]
MRLLASARRFASFHIAPSTRRALRRSLGILGLCSSLSACGSGDPEPDNGSEAGGRSGMGGTSGTSGTSG